MTISRKGFLTGMGCAAAGAAAGVLAHVQLAPPPPPGPPRFSKPPRIIVPPRGEATYSQCGEDRIVRYILDALGVADKTYLDVGAHDPVNLNNTYLLYANGHAGVLVEPNAAMCKTLREARPHDTVLEAGIGVTAAREADYYVMSEPSWNTFSKEEAERQARATKNAVSIKEVIKMPLLDINQVMADHFDEPPAFLSVDTQGFELPILKSIDYARFRPKVICAETLVTGTRKMVPETAAFMGTRGYVIRGMTFVNTIFVDSNLI